MWKLPIQYIVLGFEPTQHESHPITTRPWLPTFSTKFVYLPSWTDSTYCLVFQKRNSLPLGPIRAFISFHKREPKWRCWTDLPQRVYSQRIRHLHGRVEKIQKRSSRSQRASFAQDFLIKMFQSKFVPTTTTFRRKRVFIWKRWRPQILTSPWREWNLLRRSRFADSEWSWMTLLLSSRC